MAAEALVDLPDAEGLNRHMTQQVLAESLREWAIDRVDDVSESLAALGRAITIVDELVDDHPDNVFYRRLLVGRGSAGWTDSSRRQPTPNGPCAKGKT
jgi:hypothetical protein